MASLRYTSSMKIVCIPGLGANYRTFTPQKSYFGDRVVIPEYIKPNTQEKLETYCKRWAPKINHELAGEPCVLLGMSFGGMCVQELSRYIPAKAIILLGSTQKPVRFKKMYPFFEHIGRLSPDGLINVVGKVSPYIIAYTEGLDEQSREIVAQMMQEKHVDFYRWQVFAGAQWIQHGFEGEYTCPVFSAHGARDTVIFPQKNSSEYDLYIEDGHHLINLSHAAQINRFIEECIAKLMK